MNFLSVLELICGVTLVVSVLHDVFQSVVLPRWTSRRFRFAPVFLDALWKLWRRIGDRKTDTEAREDFFGAFAPLALMGTLGLWVVLMMLGYGICFWALRSQEKPQPGHFLEAIYIAGETLLTIGYGDFTPVGGVARVVAVSAGATGLALFALVISFLFTLYGTFERREVMVVTLDARAGSPPSGVSLLQGYSELDSVEALPDFFIAWEEWSAQVLQSHIAYPILPFFRSSHEGESWVAALGAVLDAATLLVTTLRDDPRCAGRPLGAAHIMVRIGCHTVIDLSHWFGFRFDESPDKQPGVERGEFVAARRKLAKSGWQLRDEEESWQEFSRQRSAYAASLNELAKLLAAPPSQWIGDRSMLAFSNHRAPKKSRRELEAPAETARQGKRMRKPGL